MCRLYGGKIIPVVSVELQHAGQPSQRLAPSDQCAMPFVLTLFTWPSFPGDLGLGASRTRLATQQLALSQGKDVAMCYERTQ